jgi:molybdopterin-guanine dinucleotide biosynthesis protein A
MDISKTPVIGVLLAGGRSRRMGGGEKPLRNLHGRPLIAHAAARLAPQCEAVIVSANGDPATYADLTCAVVADSVADFAGPLAGILSALEWAATHRPDLQWIVSVAADCPFLPDDLVAKLFEAKLRDHANMAFASSGGQIHHTIGLWPIKLRDDLRYAVAGEGIRKVSTWTARFACATADWPTTPFDPFFNVNTPDDLAQAEALVASSIKS